MKNLFISLAILFACFNSYSQDLPCAPPVGVPPSDIAIFRTAITDSQVLKIPIVFTVLYNTDAQNVSITDADLNDQIRILNEDFRARNTDRNTVVSLFQSIIGDCRFEFCLKEIRRVRTTTVNFPNFLANFDPAQGGVTCVDAFHNCNIYFTNIEYAGGQSIFPNSGTVGQPYDGNLIRIQSFLGAGKRINTHELGHWFGLPHTFNGECIPPGDGIDDTPPTKPASGTAGGCPTTFAPCGVTANVQNHMDYSNCRVMFTQKQCEKMRTVAFTLRTALWNPNQCGAPSPDNPPVVLITSPVNNATFTAPANIPINVIATDDKGVTKVEFYNGSTLLSTDVSAPYSFNWTNVASGSYTINAKAYDATQNRTASVNVFVNPTTNPPPSVSITSPINGTQFNVGAIIGINVSATDNGFVSKVDFLANGSFLASDATVPYGIAIGGMPAGNYVLTAKAYDNLNAATISAPVTVTVISSVSDSPIIQTTLLRNGSLKFKAADGREKIVP